MKPAIISIFAIFILCNSSCVNDNDIKKGELGLLYSNPKMLTLAIEQQYYVYIQGGSQPYSISSKYDTNIVSANFVFPNGLLVKGKLYGSVDLEIKDYSGTYKVDIHIVVKELSANPSPLTAVRNNVATNLLLAGGKFPYSISHKPDSSIATISSSDSDRFNITGVSLGNTSVEFQDASSPPKTIMVPINTVSTFMISSFPKPVKVGNSISFYVKGGTTPYGIARFENGNIATGYVTDSIVTIKGVKEGVTNIWLLDNSNPRQVDYTTIQVMKDSL